MVMLVMSFFGWWYGRGWAAVARSLDRRLRFVVSEFSIAQLLRTFFSPWRRIITYPGASLNERWHAWLDNLFSRLIGSTVRFFVLLAAVIAMLSAVVLSLVQVIIWPLLPLAVPGCLVAGLLI